MQKRGQIAIFIIIGLLGLAAVGLVIFFSGDESVTPVDQEVASDLQMYVDTCLETVSEDAVFSIAKSGGSYAPDVPVVYKGEGLNSLAWYETVYGYHVLVLTVEDMEEELETRISAELEGCVDLTAYLEKGYEAQAESAVVDVEIGLRTVDISADYPISVSSDDASKSLDSFSATLNIPLRAHYLAAVDIANSEAASGFFDKEEFMLEHGGELHVEKHRPYPDIIYEVRRYLPDYDRNLIYRFAIKGLDTTGKEYIVYEDEGCCMVDDVCFKNVEDCPGTLDPNEDCECKNLQATVTGCCEDSGRCTLTEQAGCSGTFYPDDLRCLEAECTNLDCPRTYNFLTNDFSGPPRKHGDSWCVYESMVDQGLDYVGSRHYMHSCIDGIEYVEECRDYREEMCIEGAVEQDGFIYRKSRCRLNRWWDCYQQESEEDCLSDERDCAWAGYLYSDLHCHPRVAPGLKFWEASRSEYICNVGSLEKDWYGETHPRSWGQSTVVYCQRLGDCGNYRNIADTVSLLGYYNPDGDPYEWAYWDPGWIYRGFDYVIAGDFEPNGSAEISDFPPDYQDGDVECGSWVAPVTDDCERCTETIYPCTEYRCKSLGSNCVYSNGQCFEIQGDDKGPVVELGDIHQGWSYTRSKDTYYGGTRYNISPKILPFRPFYISFTTDEPARCKLSLSPPGIAAFRPEIPEILLGGNDYRQDFAAEISMPYVENLSSHLLFIKCHDQMGNSNTPAFLAIEVSDAYAEPEVLEAGYSGESLEIYMNKPFDSCHASSGLKPYANMTSLNCSTGPGDVLYIRGKPLGSYLCKAAYSGAGHVACKDDMGKEARYALKNN